MIDIYLAEGYDRSLAPVPAQRNRDWWQDNAKTANHIHHCLPLVMANSLGYYILSPGTFTVEWDGDTQKDCRIEVLDASPHLVVDDHAAFGSFTVQAQFIPRTANAGDFVYVKGIANERCCPYYCMEAMIEAWWSWARFGLVFLLNQPGKFLIRRGQPLAQMFLYRGEAGHSNTKLHGSEELPEGYMLWKRRRERPDYRKDLEYLRGRHPDGTPEPGHVPNWRHGVE